MTNLKEIRGAYTIACLIGASCIVTSCGGNSGTRTLPTASPKYAPVTVSAPSPLWDPCSIPSAAIADAGLINQISSPYADETTHVCTWNFTDKPYDGIIATSFSVGNLTTINSFHELNGDPTPIVIGGRKAEIIRLKKTPGNCEIALDTIRGYVLFAATSIDLNQDQQCVRLQNALTPLIKYVS